MQKWLRKLRLKLTLLTQKSIFCPSVTFQMWVANFNFNYLCHFCINFENSCAHHQEEILTIPKHPQKSSFWWWLAEKTAKNEVAPKIEYQNNFSKTLSSLEHHNLASDSSNWASRGCFGIVMISSWRWAQRFFKLMHPKLSNTLKTILKKYCANCIERLSAAKNSINNKSVSVFIPWFCRKLQASAAAKT